MTVVSAYFYAFVLLVFTAILTAWEEMASSA